MSRGQARVPTREEILAMARQADDEMRAAIAREVAERLAAALDGVNGALKAAHRCGVRRGPVVDALLDAHNRLRFPLRMVEEVTA